MRPGQLELRCLKTGVIDGAKPLISYCATTPLFRSRPRGSRQDDVLITFGVSLHSSISIFAGGPILLLVYFLCIALISTEQLLR